MTDKASIFIHNFTLLNFEIGCFTISHQANLWQKVSIMLYLSWIHKTFERNLLPCIYSINYLVSFT